MGYVTMKTRATQSQETSKGRHPLLKLGTIAHEVHVLLKKNREVGLTIAEIATRLGHKYQTVNGCLQRLKGEGLVIPTQGYKGNRTVTKYIPVIENETGSPRDRVQIHTVVYVNAYGEYSAKSCVVNQLATAEDDNPVALSSHTHYVVVPKTTESFKTRQNFNGDPLQVHAKHEPLVIEPEIEETRER